MSRYCFARVNTVAKQIKIVVLYFVDVLQISSVWTFYNFCEFFEMFPNCVDKKYVIQVALRFLQNVNIWRCICVFYVFMFVYLPFLYIQYRGQFSCVSGACTCVNGWFCAWAWIYLFVCVCVYACGCVCWCLLCALLLMHRHSRDVCTNGSWSCRGCIDCSDLQIIALKSDQQQPTKVKTSLTNRSPAALPWEATCLIVCGVLRPLLFRALGEKGKSRAWPFPSIASLIHT